MGRKQMILSYLKQYAINTEEASVVTSFLADHLQLSRHNVSTDLNELYREGIVAKSEGRPVRYWLKTAGVSKQPECFTQLIGFDGSLKHVVELAKASVIYPPNGLNTIISGPSGSGKSYLAELMFQYAVETKTIQEHAPFIIFNCADYANNPQLLLSQLFGHSRGSFTGAESVEDGFIMKANHGLLFLDEVHRLPPEGQEMLFLLIDKGYFYKLGDSSKPLHVSLRIITATSISPKDSLLTTFIRRFPTQIILPSLSERPVYEKLNLMMHYFQEEANHLGISLLVRSNCMIALLAFNMNGNIGELKNTIRLACAKAFLNYISTEKIDDLIRIYITHLPGNLQIHYFSENIQLQELESIVTTEEIMFFHQGEEHDSSISPSFTSQSRFEEVIVHYVQSGLTLDEIKKLLKKDIAAFLRQLNKTYPQIDKKDCDVGQFVYALEKELRCFFQADFENAITQYLRYVNSMNSLQIHDDACENYFHTDQKYQCITKHIGYINDIVDCPLSYAECIVLSCFADVYAVNKHQKNMIQIIVLCHGDTTASSLVHVAVQLLDYENITAINMPLDSTVSMVEGKVREKLDELDDVHDVLLIVDMGSLKSLKEFIQKIYRISVGILDMATTLLVIEACKMAKYSNMSADTIADTIAANYSIDAMQSTDTRKVILTSCLTGRGTAKRLIDFLHDFLIQNNIRDVDVIAIDEVSDVHEYANYHNILAIVGTVNPHYQNIPFIGIERLLFENGKDIIHELMVQQIGKMAEYESSQEIETVQDAKQMAKQFVYDNLDKEYRDNILICVFETLSELEEKMNIRILPTHIARFVIHYSFCIERLLHDEPIMECNELHDIEIFHADLFNLITSVSAHHLPVSVAEIPKEELAYVTQIFL